MSHFAILAVTPDLNPGTLEGLMQPFHEYECTGIRDEYVVDVDETAEARAIYEKETTTALRDADGVLHSFFTPAGEWDPRFSQPAAKNNEFDRDRRERFIPPGYEEVEVPRSELEDFVTWAAGYYGKDTVKGAGDNVSVIRTTNPNKKWDWWVVGGRWRGMLRLKPGAVGRAGDLDTFDRLAVIDGKKPREVEGVDQARMSDLDLEAMRLDAVAERREAVRAAYDRVSAKTLLQSDESITELWNEFRALYQAADAAYEAQAVKSVNFWDFLDAHTPRLKALRDLDVHTIGTFGWDRAGVPESEIDPFAWAERAPALQLFGYLDAAQGWVERGEMGWFACVSNEKEPNEWEDQFARLLAAVPADHFVSVVNCHI